MRSRNQSLHPASRPAEQSRTTGEIERDLEAAGAVESPDSELCLRIARRYAYCGEASEAFRWLAKVADSTSAVAWLAASNLLRQLLQEALPETQRSLAAAVTSSYTSAQLVPMLQLAALRVGIALSVYESPYSQYRQELLDPASGLYAADADYIVIATDAHAVGLPVFSDAPDEDLTAEQERWASLWDAVAKNSRARVIQHNFAIPPENAFGHLSVRVPGSRYTMLQNLNLRLAAAAGDNVSLVDCERIASQYGKERWFDPRYWHFSKQAVSLEALPTLARNTIAVIAAAAGLTRKCLVVDLDNTLWGGVIGEEGLPGIDLGRTPAGEAFVALQEYLLQLKERGVLLAVVSKNNDADARQPFLEHPDMRLRLDDFAAFVANWNDKASNIRELATALSLGLDAFVLLDDNPSERQLIRELLSEVEVVTLPPDPSGFVRALSDSLWFEATALTAEDVSRAQQYQVRRQVIDLRARTSTLGDFYTKLGMEATIEPFADVDLPRIAQLVSKTNQFNLTTRRHSAIDIANFMADPQWVTLSVRLWDAFADHGLVGVLIGTRDDDACLEIDTWLMSCRVIGRTLEDTMLNRLCQEACKMDCTALRGTFVPTSKNDVVKDLYPRLGFSLINEQCDGSTLWAYDVSEAGVRVNPYIRERDL